MFRRNLVSNYLKFGVLSAVLYSITVIVFLSSADYSSTWWLFVGNALFLCVIVAQVLAFNRLGGGDESTQNLVAGGHIATGAGILMSCVIGFLLLLIMVPGAFGSNPPVVMEDAPSQTGSGPTNGMIFMLFMNTVLGNLCAGSFASIIVPYTAIRNQTKDHKSKVLNN